MLGFKLNHFSKRGPFHKQFMGSLLKSCENSSWWRHQMETFSAFVALCERNSPVTGESLSQRPVPGSFYVFFHLCLNKRFSTQSRRRWFETPSRSLLIMSMWWINTTVPNKIISIHLEQHITPEHIWIHSQHLMFKDVKTVKKVLNKAIIWPLL